MTRLLVITLAAGLLQTPADPSRRLYLATLAAAESALRLHETDRLKHWLREAPAEHRGWEWRYLSARADEAVASIEVAAGTINDVAVSPDGRLLAAAGADGTTRIIDAATRAVRHTLKGHTAAVWSPEFSADGTRLATVSSDGTARIWDVASGRELQTMKQVGRGVAGITWGRNDVVAAASWDQSRERGVWGVISVFNTRSGERLQHFEHGVKPIASIGYTPDGESLLVGTWDFDVAVYSTADWRKQREMRPPDSEDYKAAFALALSPDGRRAASAHADQRVRVWDVATGALLTTLYTPAEGMLRAINDVTFLPDGQRIATGGDDLTVRLWDAASGRELGVYHGHDRAVQSVASSPDGRTLYSAAADGTVRVWDLEALAPARRTWRVPNEPYAIAFDPAGTRAVFSTWEGWIRIVNVASGRELHAWQGHKQSAVGAAWSADGKWIATTGNDGRVALWDANTRALVKDFTPRTGQILSVQFSPDSTLMAAGGAPGTVHLWRVPSGEPAGTLSGGSEAAVGYLAFSPDGRSIAAGSSDGIARVWDVASHVLQHRLELGTRAGTAVSFHPGGGRLVAAAGRAVKIWNPRDGRAIATLPPALASVLTIAYSPDGQRLALGQGSNTFELWDAESGDVLLRFPQVASAWFTTWTKRDDLVLIPLDKTVRLLK